MLFLWVVHGPFTIPGTLPYQTMQASTSPARQQAPGTPTHAPIQPVHSSNGSLLAAALCLALPWLNPFSYGPMPVVPQALVVWMFAAVYWLYADASRLDAQARVYGIALGWAVAALCSAAFGLLQYKGYDYLFKGWVDYAELGQAYGNLRQRNQFATLLGIGIAAVLWFAVPARTAGQPPSAECSPSTGQPPSTLHPLVWQSSIVLLAVAMAASGSRTGMLQLLLLLALCLMWKRGQGYLLLVLLSYLLAAWLLPLSLGQDPFQSAILGRLGEDAAPCSSRLTLWSNVLHLIAQKPWLGWGWGELKYAHFFTLYPGSRFCEILGNAHNLPLHLAAELGVPVAVLVCGSVVWWVLRQKPWREAHATRQLAWMVLAVIGLHSLLEYPLWYGPFQLAAALALWLLWSTPPGAAAAASSVAFVPKPKQKRRLAQALAAALLLVCSYIAWDYWRITQIYLPSYERSAVYMHNTLEKIQASWLFRNSVEFAELSITPLTPANARHIHTLALEMLHFSPESLVLEKLIESARLLGHAAEADFYALRYQRAYPANYAEWAQKHGAQGW